MKVFKNQTNFQLESHNTRLRYDRFLKSCWTHMQKLLLRLCIGKSERTFRLSEAISQSVKPADYNRTVINSSTGEGYIWRVNHTGQRWQNLKVCFHSWNGVESGAQSGRTWGQTYLFREIQTKWKGGNPYKNDIEIAHENTNKSSIYFLECKTNWLDFLYISSAYSALYWLCPFALIITFARFVFKMLSNAWVLELPSISLTCCLTRTACLGSDI